MAAAASPSHPNGAPMAGAGLPCSRRTTDGRGREREWRGISARIPKQLFALPQNVGDWDMIADGKRFLVSMPPKQESASTPITVVLNWQAELKK
jgi:hypothetical protein